MKLRTMTVSGRSLTLADDEDIDALKQRILELASTKPGFLDVSVSGGARASVLVALGASVVFEEEELSVDVSADVDESQSFVSRRLRAMD
jgi:hypothetical protein